MKKFIKILSAALALILAISSVSMTSYAAIDSFLISQLMEYEVDPTGMWADQPTIKVEKSNHIPQRVDLTPEQIQGLVASTLAVPAEIDSINKKYYNPVEINTDIPYQPMYYGCCHSHNEYYTPYLSADMIEKVNYLGDYVIGGTLDHTKVIYEAQVTAYRNYEGKLLTQQEMNGLISYDYWLSQMGTSYNILEYQAFYRTTYNYAIIVNGQNSPTFNVGTNILAVISPLGDRMYFDVFGLDANGNVYIPDGYHYYNSLLNISYQEYKHYLGICRCTGAIYEKDRATIAASLARGDVYDRQNYIIPETDIVCLCVAAQEAENIKYQAVNPTVEEKGLDKILQKINGKSYTPVVIK